MLGRRINRLIIYKTHVCRYPLMCLYVFKVRHKQCMFKKLCIEGGAIQESVISKAQLKRYHLLCREQ